MTIVIIAAVLAGDGTYLVLQRGMLRIVIDMILISHIVNLIILSTGTGAWHGESLLGDEATVGASAIEQMVNPLPQVFVLTVIVITMAITALALVLAGLGRSDDTCIHEDHEAIRQLSAAGRRAGKNVPVDSDFTVTGTPGVPSALDKFPRETLLGGDEKW